MDKKRVFVLGDSISIHYGPDLQRMIFHRLHYDRKGGEDALIDLDNPMGANGGDSQMVRDYLQQELVGNAAIDLLVLNCGLHDIKVDPASQCRQVPIDAYRQNLAAICTLVQQAGMETIWVRTTPVDEERHNRLQPNFHRFETDVLAYNAVADQVTAAAGIRRIDLYGLTKSLGSDVYCDHVHFRPEIRAVQAAYIAGFLQCFVDEA